MTDRRGFLSALSGTLTGVAILPGWAQVRPARPRVEAEPTVFRANPDGRLTLVRFLISGVEAPAGRLRVYDRRRQLLGTAGVIRSGDTLYGELWLPVEGGTTVRSELEAPGVSGIHRSDHRLRPRRRWTIYWLTVIEPAQLARVLGELGPLERGVQTAAFVDAGVMGNPLTADALDLLDHIEFLRVSLPARDLELDHGIPASPVAMLHGNEGLPATAVLALAGSGVSCVAREWRSGVPPFEWWTGPDGSRLLSVAIPPDGDPRTLGFAVSRNEMTHRIERWLETTPLLLAPGEVPPRGDDEGVTFVVDTGPDASIASMLAAAREWNQRFAYPRIVVGPGNDRQAIIGRARGVGIPTTRPPSPPRADVPDLAALTALAAGREAARGARVNQVVRPLTALLGSGGPEADALAAIAREITTELPGTLVLNSTPFHRSDAALLPDGSVRVVTDVPGLGYAFLVDAPRGTDQLAEVVPARPPYTVAAGEYVRLQLDPLSGAIRSLVTRDDDSEWVAADGDGLNAVPGANLEKLERETIPGVGVRLTVRRWSHARGELRTTVTVYEALPWIDIENDAAALGTRPMEYLFGFSGSEPQVAWEVPAGHEDARAPVHRIAHLRWLTLRNQTGTVLFRGHDAPFASVLGDGTLRSFAPRGRARYRLQVTTDPVGPPTAARFGWGAEPFVVAPAVGTGGGRLPRHGALLVVDQPGVAILGIKPADDGEGVVVYLQELLGSSRFVSLGTGLITFASARLVDLVERDRGQGATSVPHGVIVQLPAWGVTAVRLDGIALRGT
jgi:hypothetical protein